MIQLCLLGITLRRNYAISTFDSTTQFATCNSQALSCAVFPDPVPFVAFSINFVLTRVPRRPLKRKVPELYSPFSFSLSLLLSGYLRIPAGVLARTRRN